MLLLWMVACAGGCPQAPETQPAPEFEPLKDLGQIVTLPSGVRLSIPAGFQMTDRFDPGYVLVYGEQERLIKRKAVVGDPRREQMLYETREFGQIAWSPEGSKIYDCFKQIFEFDIRRGEVRELTKYRLDPATRASAHK